MNFKRFHKSLCTLSLAALYTFTTFGATITDVTSAHWAYSAIANLESKGIMPLNSSGQFLPNQLMNYFEVADVLAKATGYVDKDVTANADATLVAQIAANYEKQKPILHKYMSKYSTWNGAYNQQIAYLLGKGCLTTGDLDKFIIQSGKTEQKAVLTKEELSIFIVKILGKAVTAKQNYKTPVFKDEDTISEEARPYMAYLMDIGVLSADANGNGNGKAKVTKALCAKMLDSALQIKENTSEPVTTPTDGDGKTALVKKVLSKNTTEYYLLLQMGSNTSYYSIKNTTKILDTDGTPLSITKITDKTLKVTLAMEGTTEYVTSAQVVDPNSTNSSVNTDTNVNDNTNGTSDNQQDISGNVNTGSIFTGTLVQDVTNGICRIALSSGETKTFILDTDCVVTLDGQSADPSELGAGDTVTAYGENSILTKLQATADSSKPLTEGTIVKKTNGSNYYAITIKDSKKETTINVASTASIIRNGRNVDITKLRQGDKVNVTQSEQGVVTALTATGVKTKVSGTIAQITMGKTTQIAINSNNATTTYTIASDAEIYDLTKDQVISIRDLHLGQKASLILDSDEVISLDVDSQEDNINVIGTITKVGRGASYIEVLLEYDYITGESKVTKRIELSDDVKVALNGKKKDIYDLEKDMSIVLCYKYLDDTKPQKILIIS